MDEGLYRREAIAALSKPAYGRPVASVPRSWCWTGALLALTLTVAALIAAQAEHVRSADVRGWIVASDGAIRVTSDRAARVSAIHVIGGDRVAAGQPLFTLSHDSQPDAATEAGLRTERSLGNELDSLAERREIAVARYRDEQRAAERREAQLAAELTQLERQFDGQHTQLQRSLDRLRRLDAAAARGAVPEIDVLQGRDAVTGAQLALAEIERQRLASERALADARDESRRLALEHALSDADTASRQRTLEREQISARAARRSVVTAPIAATVATVEVGRGDYVTAARLLATLLPVSTMLHAELYATSDTVAFIETGQPVKLRLDAFPHQRYGVVAGTVERAASTMLLPGDVAFSLSEPAYRIRVKLTRQEIVWRAHRYALRNGMQFSARIVLDREPLLQWLLSPVLRLES